MSADGLDWTALGSEYERLVSSAAGSEPAPSQPIALRPAQWAELASQRERLLEAVDLRSGLASSARGAASFRLAFSAA